MDDFPTSESIKEKAKKPKVVSKKSDEPKEEEFNLEEVLNSPIAQSLFAGCKDLFKKEKSDPDVCEITIKAPSAVVLKLFKVSE